MSKSLFEYFKECFTLNYANFNGRARRREFWGFVLFNALISWGLVFIFGAIGAAIDMPALGGLAYVYTLAAFLPSIAAAVRRLHDIGKSGWYLLVVFIPIAGIILIYWLCQDSQDFENEYGANPKALN